MRNILENIKKDIEKLEPRTIQFLILSLIMAAAIGYFYGIKVEFVITEPTTSAEVKAETETQVLPDYMRTPESLGDYQWIKSKEKK